MDTSNDSIGFHQRLMRTIVPAGIAGGLQRG